MSAIQNPESKIQNPPPLRLLLVDDEEDILETMSDILRISGFTIGTASSGREALERFEAQEYDVVLLDLTMPIMNGVEAMQRIRANHPGTAFIVISGHVDGELVAQAKAESLLAFLSKPINIGQLVGILKDHAQALLSRPSPLPISADPLPAPI